MAVNVEMTAGVERSIDADRFRRWPARGLGVLIVTWSAVLFVRMVRGMWRAKAAIGDYEATYGPIPIIDGVVAHQSEALSELCDTVAANAEFVYVFGPLPFFGPYLLALGGALLIWRHILPLKLGVCGFVMSLGAAIWSIPDISVINAVLE